jgi:hypothetical protein
MHTSELAARLQIPASKAIGQAAAAGLEKIDLLGFRREEAEDFLKQRLINSNEENQHPYDASSRMIDK